MKPTTFAFHTWLLFVSNSNYCSSFAPVLPSTQPRNSITVLQNDVNGHSDGADENDGNVSIVSSDESTSCTAELVTEVDSVSVSLSDILPSVTMSPRLDGLDKPTVWHEFRYTKFKILFDIRFTTTFYFIIKFHTHEPFINKCILNAQSFSSRI